MEQLTEEWFASRLGKITGSKKAHLLLSGAATRKTLLVQLFRETALASAKDIPQTAAMAEGTRLEPEAVAAYSDKTGYPVHGENDYIIHPDEPRFAFSPDGLVRDDGGVEAKCRIPEQHLHRMLYGIDKEELHQIEWGLFCSPERQWWDYLGYCPELPEKIRLFTRRITITTERREEMWGLGTKLLEDLDETCRKFKVGF